MIQVLGRVPRISAGAGALAELGTLVAGRVGAGAAVLLVADPGLAPLGLLDAARASLRRAGLDVQPFTAFGGDPLSSAVDAAAELARTARAAAVVALGGGSALDVGKAAAAVARGEHAAEAYALCARPLPRAPLVKICVPTTAGTGSETTRTAIVTDGSGRKLWLWGEELRADEVLLDPELTLDLPAALTAATGIDALVHALEAATNRNATPGNDVYAHEAIRLVARHLPRAVEQPRDLAARAAMQRAACLAGIAIDNAGTAVAHNIGHALASLRPIHHGRAVGIAMRATLPWNCAHDPEGRWAAAAAALQATDPAAAFARLVDAVGLDTQLADFTGVTAEQLAAQMARPENASMRRSNAREIDDAALLMLAARVLERS